ncbi:MAG: murein transglycosylase [Rickettsiales bacterium]|nr:murein transglycosylase [Rickettsiales bacterium]|tara:strand:+ start:22480 stop:23739 length:1260 start_codon:yes stop_codon:yes gene_type:complete
MAKIKTFLLILFFVSLSCFLTYRFHDQITTILEKIFTFRLSEESYPVKLKKVSFADLKGWDTERFEKAGQVLENVCALIEKKDGRKYLDEQHIYGQWADYKAVCKKLTHKNKALPTAKLKEVLKKEFVPYQVFSIDRVDSAHKTEALFTGYYEPILKGSRIRKGPYQYPLYKKPKNLIISQDLGKFKSELAGYKIKGRVVDGVFKPYFQRRTLNEMIGSKDLEPLVWVDSEIDAFFLHIQGSGFVQMADGTSMRVGYAEQNGRPYVSIGRTLLDMGIGTKEEMSMQFIKKWLRDNPEKIKGVLNENPSYIFFRELKGSGPIGTMGIPLVPEHNIAVDRSIYPMGLPMWIIFQDPLENEKILNKFVIAADTGGAIKGPLRGDLFWGRGKKAERYAGHMKSRGQLFVLLPKTVMPPKSVAL